MENTTEKNLKLNSKDLGNVSGGYAEKHMAHPWYSMESYDITNNEIKCDMCDCKRTEKTVIPFQGGHLCVDCIRKVEKELDRKIL